MDCWVFLIRSQEKREPNKGLAVAQLQHKAFGWTLVYEDSWEEVKGSSDFLLSMALPETRVLLKGLPLAESDPFFAFQSTVWLARDGQSMACYEPWHQLIEQEVSLIGKTIEAASFEQIEQAPAAATLLKVSQAEARQALHLCKGRHCVHPVVACLSIAFSLQGSTRKWACAIATAFIAASLAIWHLLPNWFGQQLSQQTDQFIRRFQQNQVFPSLPDWAATSEKLKKFGTDNRANLQHVVLTWNQAGEIQPRVLLTKPRERLPKDCIDLRDQWVECPVIAPSRTQGADK